MTNAIANVRANDNVSELGATMGDLSVREAAERLHRTPRRVRQLIKARQLSGAYMALAGPARMIWRIPAAAIEDYQERRARWLQMTRAGRAELRQLHRAMNRQKWQAWLVERGIIKPERSRASGPDSKTWKAAT